MTPARRLTRPDTAQILRRSVAVLTDEAPAEGSTTPATPRTVENTALARMYRAAKALTEAKRIDDVKDFRDKAEERDLRPQRDLGEQVIADASAIKLKAERRLGEMLKELPMDRGGRVVSPSHGCSMASARKPSAYSSFTVVFFGDGGGPITEDVEAHSAAGKRFKELTERIADALLFGWLPSGEPHLLNEWPEEKPSRRAPRSAQPAKRSTKLVQGSLWGDR